MELNKQENNIGYLSIGIFFFFIALTALSEGDLIYGVGILFITTIFFSKI